MAVYTFDATTSGASATSYTSVADADDYMGIIPTAYKTSWTAATTSEKQNILMWATKMLDEMVDWKGTKATTTQRLRWPRSSVYTPDDVLLSSSAIPQFLIDATTELARLELEKDLTREATRGIRRIKTGPVEIDFDTMGRQRQVVVDSVQAIIEPYHDGITQPGGRKQAVRV